MHLALDEEQEALKSSLKDFAKDRLRSGSRDWDEAGAIPDASLAEGWGLGLLLAGVPASLGGASESDKPSALTNAIALEELAWGDLAYAHALYTPNQLAVPVLLYGTDAEKREVMPSLVGNAPPAATGAWIEPHRTYDLATIRTRATAAPSGEWTISGKKTLVGNGAKSTATVVYARTLPGEGWAGVEAFLVKDATQGQMQRGPRADMMGPRAVPLHSITFENCDARRLGGPRGVDYRKLAERALVGSAAAALGVGRAASEYAAGYAKERIAFGKPIAQYQSIAFKIAESFMDVEAARWMTWKAAWKIDRGEDALADASNAFRFATDVAWRVADDGVQIHGGHGVIRDYLAELFFRNARSLAVMPGAFLV